MASPKPTGAPSFEEVYGTHRQHVARWVQRLRGPFVSLQDVEELVDDIFMVFHETRVRFDGGNLKGWLYAITVRKVANHRRWQKLRTCFFQRWTEREMVSVPAEGPSPADVVEYREEHVTLYRAIDRLPEIYRFGFVLYEIDGLSIREISELQQIPEDTVKTRLKRAREQFLPLWQKEIRKGRS